VSANAHPTIQFRVEYQVYRQARQRCENPKATNYKYYGGRGIKFLFDSFGQFIGEVGPRPPGNHASGRPLYSIHRINNDGHYEPGNIKWATDEEQHAPGRCRRPTPKTHCVRGHEFTEANTYRRKGSGKRECRICRICSRRPARATTEPISIRRGEIMEVDQAVGMMTPAEARELRRLAGWTLKRLSEEAKVNIAQLSLFENDLAGLGGRQMATCRRLLLAAAAERGAEIATLFARERAAELATAS
jgi:hypothetical protein